MDDVPTVRHDAASSRYELFVDGAVVGFAEHRPVGEGVEDFPHTVVEPGHQGQGLAGVLVRHALDDARARGVKVVPTCWFVAGWIDRHLDYRDLLTEPAI